MESKRHPNWQLIQAFADIGGRKSSRDHTNDTTKPAPSQEDQIKPSLKRYIVLFLFCLNAGNKCFQWIQIGASTKKASQLYRVENYIINTTSVIFLIICIGLSLPACYLISRFGLRPAVLAASFGTAIGALIKCFSCINPVDGGGIWLLMLGQILVSLSEQLIFSVPSRLASVWFPDNQVSSAVSLCIFGQILGIAIGFVVPLWFLSDAETDQEIKQGFYDMFWWTTAVSIVAFVLDYFLFDEEPKYAPGGARLKQRELEIEAANLQKKKHQQTTNHTIATNEPSFKENLQPFIQQLNRLIRNKNLIYLSISFGINVGTSYTVPTLVNQMMAPIWPDRLDSVVASFGFLLVLAGCFGSPISGYILDKWRCYKALNLYLNIGVLVSFIWLAYALIVLQSLTCAHSAAFLIGIFQAGFTITGLELAVELTYPEPELLTSSSLNIMPQIFGTLFTFTGSYMADNLGPLATICFYIVCTILGLIFLLCTRETLKRQAAVTSESLEKQPNNINNHDLSNQSA